VCIGNEGPDRSIDDTEAVSALDAQLRVHDTPVGAGGRDRGRADRVVYGGRLGAHVGVNLGIDCGTKASKSRAVDIAVPRICSHEALCGFDSLAQGNLVEFGGDELGVDQGRVESAVAGQLDGATGSGGDQGGDDGEEASSGREWAGRMEPVVLR
jgi:hypothetical protein